MSTCAEPIALAPWLGGLSGCPSFVQVIGLSLGRCGDEGRLWGYLTTQSPLRGAAKKVVSTPVDTNGCKRMDDVGQEA